MSTVKRKRYSPQELIIIKKLVSENPNNLSKAFNEAALELGRTKMAISIKWYTELSKTNTAFVIYSKECYNINRKNCSTSKPNSKSLFGYLKKLIFKYL